MIPTFARALTPVLVAGALAVAPASAQDQPRGGLLDNLFGGQSGRQASPQADPAELQARINQLEAHIRQLTGQVEQLQFRNQQLEQQVQRGPAGGPAGGAQVAQPLPPLPGSRPPAQVIQVPPPATPATPGRRSDVFDPTQNPNAPGVPQTLGRVPVEPPPVIVAEPPVGAPGGRAAPGAPLDLSSLSNNPPAGGAGADPDAPSAPTILPPPPSRRLSSTGAAVAPPSDTPKDHYDLGYGYVLRKDYALAETTLQNFLMKFPTDKLAADAQFWLGESLFQRQKYDGAAEAFLAASTKYEGYAKAPDALLRLGQSLAALNQKEMACATLAEVSRKYPRASSSVKQGVDREQKRVRC